MRLNGVQNGKERIARNFRTSRSPAIDLAPRCTFPAGFGDTNYTVDRRFLCICRSVFSEVKIHSALLEFFDPDRRGFELRGSGLGIDRIDRQVVGRYLIVEM